ncbi:hypothetical protein Amet_4392 [Alkaliphilus metalliredigens QYMF]|uniref:Uncharacterized protein n=1 Tax=Alkaliphilus metalliredigens (strain QYMF) TaxID=293826 RepID=A6TKA0_ALKMQ|nr:hypothetical protein [Alkaliphilus metalliredigens]ABR46618.1 hypothetical protein Amet_0390 [Alkaliphilus metalliredigens QYMF]ABR48091.1 hypothetical protein Amet_1928 [Alkaliphilus metalliredigens QYMF]ABR50466.1 hypothetical protein Amet_4392 [Alkaliphilus metalliredigens QYMF]
MASGCILDTCWVCDDLVWEDDWILYNEQFIHPACAENKTQLMKDKASRLHYEDEMTEDLQMLKRMLGSCQKEIERLENLIKRRA